MRTVFNKLAVAGSSRANALTIKSSPEVVKALNSLLVILVWVLVD